MTLHVFLVHVISRPQFCLFLGKATFQKLLLSPLVYHFLFVVHWCNCFTFPQLCSTQSEVIIKLLSNHSCYQIFCNSDASALKTQFKVTSTIGANILINGLW